jgi:hypothetical protein
MFWRAISYTYDIARPDISSGFLPPTMSYVTYDIVRPDVRYRTSVLDIVRHIVPTISYVRYSWTGRTILDIRYRTSERYRMSTYDIVRLTYDIVGHHEYISYTISYVQKYIRYRTSSTFYIVGTYRIRYRTSDTISYVYIRYRMLLYDIVFDVRYCIIVTTSYVNIRCRMSDVRYRTSVFKASPSDLNFSQSPRPMRGHMGRVFSTSCTFF